MLDMSRTDATLLEVVDCYHLDKCPKQAISWLFEILEPFQNNAAEKTALKLIEEYKYSDLLYDYPNYYTRLSDIYIKKAFLNYKSNTSTAASDIYQDDSSQQLQEGLHLCETYQATI